MSGQALFAVKHALGLSRAELPLKNPGLQRSRSALGLRRLKALRTRRCRWEMVSCAVLPAAGPANVPEACCRTLPAACGSFMCMLCQPLASGLVVASVPLQAAALQFSVLALNFCW